MFVMVLCLQKSALLSFVCKVWNLVYLNNKNVLQKYFYKSSFILKVLSVTKMTNVVKTNVYSSIYNPQALYESIRNLNFIIGTFQNGDQRSLVRCNFYKEGKVKWENEGKFKVYYSIYIPQASREPVLDPNFTIGVNQNGGQRFLSRDDLCKDFGKGEPVLYQVFVIRPLYKPLCAKHKGQFAKKPPTLNMIYKRTEPLDNEIPSIMPLISLRLYPRLEFMKHYAIHAY